VKAIVYFTKVVITFYIFFGKHFLDVRMCKCVNMQMKEYENFS
jgi:hypothetical protein